MNATAKKDVPFNAGDEAHVEERKKAAGLRDDLRLEGLRFIMGDRRGRAYMRHLLLEKMHTRIGAQLPRAIFTGNSSTFYNAALVEVGGQIAAEIEEYCENEFAQLKREAKP